MISYLVEFYEKQLRNEELFHLFCQPVEDVDFDDPYSELMVTRAVCLR